MKIEEMIKNAVGNKPFVAKATVMKLCQDMGLCGSPTGANAIIKKMKWIAVSPKRLVISKEDLIAYFSNL